MTRVSMYSGVRLAVFGRGVWETEESRLSRDIGEGFQPEQRGEWKCHSLRRRTLGRESLLGGGWTPSTHPGGAVVRGVSSTDSELRGEVWAGGINLSVKSPWELPKSMSREK